MDPESGASLPVAAATSSERDENVVQHVIHVLLEKLKTLFEAIAPKKHRDVGVENRFYFDQTEKVWKLHGGEMAQDVPLVEGEETEEERREAEQFRFHTGRGLSSAYHAPATTACDASRGSALPPPPPSAGPVTASLHGACDLQSSALAHPVYAPQGLGSAPPSGPPGYSQQPRPLANPFAGGPLQSPFGAPPAARAPGVPLASPFGASDGANVA